MERERRVEWRERKDSSCDLSKLHVASKMSTETQRTRRERERGIEGERKREGLGGKMREGEVDGGRDGRGGRGRGRERG